MKDQTYTCVRCGKDCLPLDMRLQCPANPEHHGRHEIANPPEWKFGDTMRQGSSLHASDCEAANPSVWEEFPCNCGLLRALDLVPGTSSPSHPLDVPLLDAFAAGVHVGMAWAKAHRPAPDEGEVAEMCDAWRSEWGAVENEERNR